MTTARNLLSMEADPMAHTVSTLRAMLPLLRDFIYGWILQLFDIVSRFGTPEIGEKTGLEPDHLRFDLSPRIG